MDTLLLVSWIFLPLVGANPGPVIANNIKLIKDINYPMDFYKSFRGKRVLGSHKTFRGLASGIIAGGLVAFMQFLLAISFDGVANFTNIIDYSSPMIILFGMLLGLGAMLGDAGKSFFKRQVGIAPGKNWFPFDQLDFVVGAILVSLLVFRLDPSAYLVLILEGLLLHPTFNVISWLLGLQSRPF